MRVTVCLCAGIRDVTVRRWKKVWACRGRYYVYPLKVPQPLFKKGIKVVDVGQTEIPKPKWVPPVPDDPRFAEVVPHEKRLDWKTEPAFAHHDNVRLFEGIKQACLIAKAQHFEGFPPAVEGLIGALDIEDKDLLLQRYIMQSRVWNTDEDRLPKPFDPRKPRWHWTAQYGITSLKSSQILLRNFLRLCQLETFHLKSCQRTQIADLPLYSYINYKGKPIVMNEVLDLVLTSPSPLPLFADKSAVAESVGHKIPDMWPVFPTVDFLQTNNYTLSNNLGFVEENPLLTPHTIIQIPRKTNWEQKHYQASQIMSSLMYTAALARRKYGEDVKILPEPITIQHVAIQDSWLLYTFFQLNTLDFDSDDGIKNLVWTAPQADLFKILRRQPWMPRIMRKDRYIDYNPTAFDQFLAVYMSGGSKDAVKEKLEAV
ncbi:large ribosomal subunit protein mL37-like [Physella acuta]|uniref:large ribosomal subunit protein mL37-like n=1 Tax=Physella acuta TaxID=109671 RepID=UPI0027DAD37F|nr:large ribosomal subunit protein mL37-like [Physella acuta]